jgi:hypothetical protein
LNRHLIKVYLGTLSINRDDGDGTTSGRPRRRSLYAQLESCPVNGAALGDERRRGARFEAVWVRCVEHAVVDEGRDNARQWRTAFRGTEGAWWKGYTRASSRAGSREPLAMLVLPCDEPRDPVDAHEMLTNA